MGIPGIIVKWAISKFQNKSWVRLHKNTYDYWEFSATALCLPVYVLFKVLLSTFSPDLFTITWEEILQSTGNGYRKSHVIFSVFMHSGPGAQAFIWKWVLLACLLNTFSYERLCTKTRFETEVKDNLEMAFWLICRIKCSVKKFDLFKLYKFYLKQKFGIFTTFISMIYNNKVTIKYSHFVATN